MKFTRLFTENRAVSPVIGVILMVAITVILAAVIGTFVLGIAPGEDPAPSAQLTFDAGDGTDIEVTHSGGDTMEIEDLTILINGSVIDGVSFDDPGETFAPGETKTIQDDSASPNWGAGDSVDVTIRHDPSGAIVGSSTVDIP